MKKETGGAAFSSSPAISPDGSWMRIGCEGMTLRDYFAGQALKGLSSAHKADDGTWAVYGCEIETAELSYRLADAMLAERGKV